MAQLFNHLRPEIVKAAQQFSNVAQQFNHLRPEIVKVAQLFSQVIQLLDEQTSATPNSLATQLGETLQAIFYCCFNNVDTIRDNTVFFTSSIMQDLTVPISRMAYEALNSLATESGETLQAVLDKAIESFRRQLFWEDANRAFATLRNDSAAWVEEREECEAWERSQTHGAISDNWAGDRNSWCEQSQIRRK